MSQRKFAELKKKLLKEAQIPDDGELKRDLDVDSSPEAHQAAHLPIHDSDAAPSEPMPVLDKLPKRDVDPKDLSEEEDEELDEEMSDKELEEEDEDEDKHIKEMAARLFETEKEDLDEEEDEDKLDEEEDKEDLDEEEDSDEEELEEMCEVAVDEITPQDLEEVAVGDLTDVPMHNKIDEMDHEELDEEEDELEESEEDKEKASKEMQESIKTLLRGSKLSTEAQKKIAKLFESAVSERVSVQKRKVVKLYNRKLQESKVKTLTKLVNELDEFHEYAVQEWLKENKLAVEKGIRTEIAEEFIVGLKNLFLEHNISIPEEENNLLELSLTKLEKLEKQLNEQYNKTLAESKKRKALEKELVLREATEKLSDAQAEKLRRLCEHVAFSDRTEFQENVQLIIENYFGKKSAKSGKLDSKIMSTGGIKEEKNEKQTSHAMQVYSQALSTLVKDE